MSQGWRSAPEGYSEAAPETRGKTTFRNHETIVVVDYSVDIIRITVPPLSYLNAGALP